MCSSRFADTSFAWFANVSFSLRRLSWNSMREKMTISTPINAISNVRARRCDFMLLRIKGGFDMWGRAWAANLWGEGCDFSKVKKVSRAITEATLAALCLSLGVLTPAVAIESLQPVEGKVEVERLVEGLKNPWALAFLPNKEGILITERDGNLRLWREASLSAPIGGLPAVYAKGQGGLLDVALSPKFSENRII